MLRFLVVFSFFLQSCLWENSAPAAHNAAEWRIGCQSESLNNAPVQYDSIYGSPEEIFFCTIKSDDDLSDISWIWSIEEDVWQSDSLRQVRLYGSWGYSTLYLEAEDSYGHQRLDSIILKMNNSPQINSLLLPDSTESMEVFYGSGLLFQWDADDKDIESSKDSLYYEWKLYQQNISDSSLLSTVKTTHNYYYYADSLYADTKYFWIISASDKMNKTAKDTSWFTTGGTNAKL
jgi:hypothetical protein